MILADTKDALQYLGINPNLDAALIKISENAHMVEPGHYELEGDKLWLNCFDYETLPENKVTYEAHEHYGDIHIVQSGREKIFISRPSNLKVLQKKPEDDYIELVGESDHEIVLVPGSFLVVFPNDAHQIKMQVQGPEKVRKSVFKFKL